MFEKLLLSLLHVCVRLLLLDQRSQSLGLDSCGHLIRMLKLAACQCSCSPY